MPTISDTSLELEIRIDFAGFQVVSTWQTTLRNLIVLLHLSFNWCSSLANYQFFTRNSKHLKQERNHLIDAEWPLWSPRINHERKGKQCGTRIARITRLEVCISTCVSSSDVLFQIIDTVIKLCNYGWLPAESYCKREWIRIVNLYFDSGSFVLEFNFCIWLQYCIRWQYAVDIYLSLLTHRFNIKRRTCLALLRSWENRELRVPPIWDNKFFDVFCSIKSSSHLFTVQLIISSGLSLVCNPFESSFREHVVLIHSFYSFRTVLPPTAWVVLF